MQYVRRGSFEHAQMLLKNANQTLGEATKNLEAAGSAAALARGKVFELVGYFPEAVESYRHALIAEPGNTEAAGRLAIAQLKAGKTRAALAAATELAAGSPEARVKALATDEVVSAMTILGDALASSGRPVDAAIAYGKALEIDRGDSYAAGRLAQTVIATGGGEKLDGLDKLVGDNPRFHGLRAGLALGAKHHELLPTLNPSQLAAAVMSNPVGRPFLAEDQAILADVVEGDPSWCSEPRY